MSEYSWQLFLSCEHGGNRVPPEYAGLFAGAGGVLQTHRGCDIGIAAFARRVAQELDAPLQRAEVTRLLVDLNRAPGHQALFSEYSRPLPERERERLLARWYHPYRETVNEKIGQILAGGGKVCHISLHSFTPELNGTVRNADIGLLYDPRRTLERRFCLAWQQRLESAGEGWHVRRNYPYRGVTDSLISFQRRRRPADRYLGLELELNQRWPLKGGTDWKRLQQLVIESLRVVLTGRAWERTVQGCPVSRAHPLS